MKNLSSFWTLLFIIVCIGCQSNETAPETTPTPTTTRSGKLFTKHKGSDIGISFVNQIKETESFNYFVFDAIYQGAGLGVGDFNNDGLDDVFFAGNMVADKLYLNKGNLNFEDISQKAGISTDQYWSTGVSVADVNADGFLDIYVCRFLYDQPERLKNLLYINNGNLTFTERAVEYGLADQGYSIQANFFDYNRDGLLDVYVENQPPNSTNSKKALKGKIDYRYTDRLYKNNGNNTFTDVTKQAGVENYSFTLSATVGDLNQDGWPDIYVSCDYEEPDYYYQNNGNGTFTNVANEALRHISNFSMGTDIADINNDGWLDIYTSDMVADDNVRLKTNMSGMNPEKFWGLANIGYHYQYMFNTLQLNNGNGLFSEIGQLAGISSTDWSWSPLFVDFDNDGNKDLIVTNGLLKEMRNNDVRISTRQFIQQKTQEAQAKGDANFRINPLDIINRAPTVPIDNFIYKNNGDLTFDNMLEEWGLSYKGFSQGAAYADFDNDGDVDVLLNNLNDTPVLFENTLGKQNDGQYIRIKLEGNKKNKFGIGARVQLNYANQTQVIENNPVRGFMSTSERTLHFGLGSHTKIDELSVQWADGRINTMKNVNSNQVLVIKQDDAANTRKNFKINPLFNPADDVVTSAMTHQENEYDDYAREILIPHRMSRLGPCLAKGDVNGDGLEDFYLGGASKMEGKLFIQKSDLSFTNKKINVFKKDSESEDIDALFFDADGDGDNDLYVVSGGNDFAEGHRALSDRLYINDGSGSFSKSSNSIEQNNISGSCVRANDYDNDGDLDLFVGGRQIPGKYGHPADSRMLQNNKGKFTDVTAEVCPSWSKLGMVTSVVWMDFDDDEDDDLIIAGEWMPISFFRNDNSTFKNVTSQMGTENTTGWWNKIEAHDLDGDGDQDLIAGNLGLNIKYKASESQPFKLFVKDFDDNGSNDVYLGYYDNDGVCYPVRGRECSSQQLPFVKKEFPTYNAFAHAPIENVLKDRMDGAIKHEAKLFSSVWLENLDGAFNIHPLPNEAQVSPLFAFDVRDWNDDGHVDILAAGNYYEREVETTRSDAGIGNLLLGNGKGQFVAAHATESGLNLFRDVRDLAVIEQKDKALLVLVANNNDQMTALKKALK